MLLQQQQQQQKSLLANNRCQAITTIKPLTLADTTVTKTEHNLMTSIIYSR